MSESSLEQSNNPCRVTFLITDLDQGGAEQALAELITRLDRTRWSPSVLCLSAEGCLMERLRATHIPVEALGARSPSEFPRLFFRLRRHLKKLQPDLLCTYLYHANIAGRLAAATIRPRPRIFSGIRVAEKRFRSRLWLDCLTNWLVNGHICVSQDVATFSHEVGKLPASKLHVLPNGIDVTRFDEAIPFDWTQLGIPADSQILLYVGRLDPQKGVQDLLTSTIPLLKQNPRLYLVMAGEGPSRQQLEQRIDLEQLHRQIRLLGHREDIPQLMRGATLLVHASHWEGAPNVLLEAMAARLPLVCTDTEGTSEILGGNRFGRCVTVGDVDAFRAAIEAFLQDPEGRRDQAESAYLHVRKEFTWKSTIQKWEEIVSSKC